MTSREFDPYHTWLGISPKHQPPNKYRLLGLEVFESHPEAIQDAAERQIAHVRRYQLGEYAEVSQRILNELAEASAILTDPSSKAAYDAKLKQQLAPPAAARPALATAEPRGASGPAIIAQDDTVSRITSRAANKRNPALIAGIAGACGLVVLGLVYAISSSDEPKQVANENPADRVEPSPEVKEPVTNKQADPVEVKQPVEPVTPPPMPKAIPEPIPESEPKSVVPSAIPKSASTTLEDEFDNFKSKSEAAQTASEHLAVAELAVSLAARPVNEDRRNAAMEILQLGLLAARKSDSNDVVAKVTLEILKLRRESPETTKQGTTATPDISSPNLRPLAELNTPNVDAYRWLSPNGLIIYWTREAPGQPSMIWTASRASSGDDYGDLQPLLEGRLFALTADQLEIIVVGGAPKDCLMSARRSSTNDPFGELTQISELRDQPRVKSPWISEDGLTLVFQRASGIGIENVVVTRGARPGPWGDVQPLRISLDRSAFPNPITWPFITKDSRMLFCCHGGVTAEK